MEGSRFPNRFILGPLIICILITQPVFYTFVYREHSFKVQRYEKVMKVKEKLTNKEKQALIIRKYQQYLKLEKSLVAQHTGRLSDGLGETCCSFLERREYRGAGNVTPG